jgi:WD40 repeat protein
LVITLRADFYDRPLAYGEFGELMQKATEVVLPLNPEELERAISGPAEQVGVQLEPGLVAQIIQEVGDQPGALPLLQYALTESFERRVGSQLSLAAYAAGGGLLGALGRRAEEIYQHLDANQQALTRQLFLRLVTLGEGTEDTRCRMLLSEIEAVDGQTKDGFRPVTDQYGRYRLITFDHDPATRAPTVELAHEALLREWPRLRSWLAESRDDIRLQRLLAGAALEWAANGREASYLLRGTRLAQFDQWVQESDLALSGDEQTYLEASLAARQERQAAEAARQAHEARLEQRSRRFLRALVGVFAVAAVIAVILSGVAFNQSNLAQENAATATYAQGEALSLAAAEATSAADAREQRDFAEEQSEARATQQAIAEAEVIARSTQQTIAEAAQVEAEIAKEEALRQASVGLANAALLELQSGYQDRAVNLALVALENYPYTHQAEQALGQAVLQSRLRRVFYHTGYVWSVHWSPDGKRLLTASDDGTAKIWEPFSGEELLSLNHENEVFFAHWSDDGTQVLTTNKVVTNDEEKWNIIIWDSYSGEKIVVMEGHTAFVNGAYWSPDGSQILSCSDDKTARIWDAKTGELIRSIQLSGWVNGALWSPDGETFVTVGEDAPTIWDASTFEQILTLKGPAEITLDARWSPEGDRLSTNPTFSFSAQVWDTSNGELLLYFPIVSFRSKSRWSPDGKKILVRDSDQPGPSIHDAVTGEKLLGLDPGISNAQPQDIVWSPSGDRVAAGFWGGIVVVWDASDGDILFMLRGHSSQIDGGAREESLHWSPDGRWLASGSRDGSVMVWDTRPDFSISNFRGTVTNARWSPTGDRILQAREAGASIYDSASGDLLLTVEAGFFPSMGDYWSPVGDKFGLGLNFGEVRIYDASTGAEDLRIVLPGNVELCKEGCWTYTFFGWSPDGKRIATGHDFDGSIRIWNAISGEELLLLRDEIENFQDGHWYVEIRWSPLGDKILTADTLQHLIVWDALTGEPIRSSI